MTKQRQLTKCPHCNNSKFKILGRIRKWFRSRLHIECCSCNRQFEV